MPAPAAEFSLETLAEVLVETRAMRRALRVHGLDTPGLDAEVAALEAAIVTARTDRRARNQPSPSEPSPRILGGTVSRGTDSVRWPPTDGGSMPKLSPADVAKIRHLGTFARAGITTQRAIAAHLNLSQSTVCDVLTGKLHPRPEPTEWRPQVRLVDLRVAPAEACEVTLAVAQDSTSLTEGALGGGKSGKSRADDAMAIAIHRAIKSRRPVAIVDTEHGAPAEACEVTLSPAQDSPSLPEGDPEVLELNHDEVLQ